MNDEYINILENNVEEFNNEINLSNENISKLEKENDGYIKFVITMLGTGLLAIPLSTLHITTLLGTYLLMIVSASSIGLVSHFGFKNEKEIKRLTNYVKSIYKERDNCIKELKEEKNKKIYLYNQKVYEINKENTLINEKDIFYKNGKKLEKKL